MCDRNTHTAVYKDPNGAALKTTPSGVLRCFVVPPDPADVQTGPSHCESAGGLCGGIPGSSFYKDWDKGYVPTAPAAEVMRGGL